MHKTRLPIVGDLVRLLGEWPDVRTGASTKDRLGVVVGSQYLVRNPMSEPLKNVIGYLVMWADGVIWWCVDAELEVLTNRIGTGSFGYGLGNMVVDIDTGLYITGSTR